MYNISTAEGRLLNFDFHACKDRNTIYNLYESSIKWFTWAFTARSDSKPYFSLSPRFINRFIEFMKFWAFICYSRIHSTEIIISVLSLKPYTVKNNNPIPTASSSRLICWTVWFYVFCLNFRIFSAVPSISQNAGQVGSYWNDKLFHKCEAWSF